MEGPEAPNPMSSLRNYESFHMIGVSVWEKKIKKWDWRGKQSHILERFAVEYVKKLKIILETVGTGRCLNLRLTRFMYISEKLLY